MSGVTAMTVLAGAALAGTAYSIYSGEQARKATRTANDRNAAAASKAADLQEQAVNKANAKVPDLQSILGANLSGNSGGAGSTLLSGKTGVDPNKLSLGKSTLLGG